VLLKVVRKEWAKHGGGNRKEEKHEKNREEQMSRLRKKRQMFEFNESSGAVKGVGLGKKNL